LSALKYNPYNYLANYYSGLCEIYDGGENGGFAAPKGLVKVLKTSIEKMEFFTSDSKYRAAFLNAALAEIRIIFLGCFNKLSSGFGAPPIPPDSAFSGGFYFLSAIHELFSVGRERLFATERGVKTALTEIAGWGLSVCRAAGSGYAENSGTVTAVSDADFKKLQRYYASLSSFAVALEPEFDLSGYAPDLSQTAQLNKGVLLLTDKYYSVNADNARGCLSTAGAFLDSLLKQCDAAVRLTYFNCVRNLAIEITDDSRAALINQGIAILFELITPRVFADSKNNLRLAVYSPEGLRSLTFYADAFYEALPSAGKKQAEGLSEDFFASVFKTVEFHFSKAVKTYGKSLNRLKRKQSEDFAYYNRLLFGLCCACGAAVKSAIKFTAHKSKNRFNLLKQCKTVCEEFLLVNDYNVEEIERAGEYADLLKIYGELEGDIATFAKFK
jgi:hypothetical protein